MEIEVKGHSGCQIDVVPEGQNIYVYKSTRDPKYLKRLVLQAEKQQAAGRVEYQHIRVPKIYEVLQAGDKVVIKMQYIYSKNFIEFFEQAGFEQVDYLIGALKYFIEYEIKQSTLQDVPAKVFQEKFADIKRKCAGNPLYKGDSQIADILQQAECVFNGLTALTIPVGLCHGDLTFSNILFNGNNYYLIDFLDSFVETPLQDIVKIRQDTQFGWSQLMYLKRYDAVRLHIVMDKIDAEIDSYFSKKYEWYRNHYHTMQLMNLLRILPYAHEEKVADFLKKALHSVLGAINLDCYQERDRKEKQGLSIASSKTVCSSLIVPVAADKPEYATGLPYVFSLDRDGVILCIKSIMGLELDKFDHIYFTILKKHNDHFFIADSLNLQFRRLGISKAKVVVLDEPTQDQAETIYDTIMQEHIEGSIFIKDADSYFKTPVECANGIAIFPIEQLDVLSPKDKSYVAVDDMYYITNIIEKSVVGHYISAGGYAIHDASTFLDYYHRLRGYGKLYFSHIIYAMLLDKVTFRPLMVSDYKDWGTRNDWSRNE